MMMAGFAGILPFFLFNRKLRFLQMIDVPFLSMGEQKQIVQNICFSPVVIRLIVHYNKWHGDDFSLG